MVTLLLKHFEMAPRRIARIARTNRDLPVSTGLHTWGTDTRCTFKSVFSVCSHELIPGVFAARASKKEISPSDVLQTRL